MYAVSQLVRRRRRGAARGACSSGWAEACRAAWRAARPHRLVCSVARAARGRTSFVALRRRLPALPHHASAGRVARAAGQAREPAAAGLVAGGYRCRARMPTGTDGASSRVHLLPPLRKLARTQPESDPWEPTHQTWLYSSSEHHRPRAAASTSRSHGAFRATEAFTGRASGRTSCLQNVGYTYRTRRLPCTHR